MRAGCPRVNGYTPTTHYFYLKIQRFHEALREAHATIAESMSVDRLSRVSLIHI